MFCIILTELFSIWTRQYPCTRMVFSVDYRTVVTCCWVDRFGWSRQCEGKYWLLSNAKTPSMCKALVYDRKQRCLVNSCGICWSGILKPKRLLKSVFRASPWFEIIHAFSRFFSRFTWCCSVEYDCKNIGYITMLLDIIYSNMLHIPKHVSQT